MKLTKREIKEQIVDFAQNAKGKDYHDVGVENIIAAAFSTGALTGGLIAGRSYKDSEKDSNKVFELLVNELKD
tara:strand:- start:678 stop:896 length:219 start_codon:yes stop_codon:yes gene_type:complete